MSGRTLNLDSQIGQQPADLLPLLKWVGWPVQNKSVVEYALPAELAASLPSVEALEAEIQADWPEDQT